MKVFQVFDWFRYFFLDLVTLFDFEGLGEKVIEREQWIVNSNYYLKVDDFLPIALLPLICLRVNNSDTVRFSYIAK